MKKLKKISCLCLAASCVAMGPLLGETAEEDMKSYIKIIEQEHPSSEIALYRGVMVNFENILEQAELKAGFKEFNDILSMNLAQRQGVMEVLQQASVVEKTAAQDSLNLTIQEEIRSLIIKNPLSKEKILKQGERYSRELNTVFDQMVDLTNRYYAICYKGLECLSPQSDQISFDTVKNKALFTKYAEDAEKVRQLMKTLTKEFYEQDITFGQSIIAQLDN